MELSVTDCFVVLPCLPDLKECILGGEAIRYTRRCVSVSSVRSGVRGTGMGGAGPIFFTSDGVVGL